MNNVKFITFEYPKTEDEKYQSVLDEHGVLRTRREQLGLTMQQVANLAGIQFSQYQRLESGERTLASTSMKIGLSVCATLLLNPFEMVEINIDQAEASCLKPHPPIIRDKNKASSRPLGRKPKKKKEMTAYFNLAGAPVSIPYAALKSIGSPRYVRIEYDKENHRILVYPITVMEENSLETPAQQSEGSLFHVTLVDAVMAVSDMNWGSLPHEVETKLVRDSDHKLCLLLDLDSATEFVYDKKQVKEFAKQLFSEITQGTLHKRDPVSHSKVIEEMLNEAQKRGFLEAVAKYGIVLDDGDVPSK